MISAGHERTADAAREILRAEGNAVDAAVAAFLVSWIAEPCMSAAGGGAFATVYAARSGECTVLDAFVQTPRQKVVQGTLDFVPIDVEFSNTTEVFHAGKASTAVPGAIAGVFALYERYGSLPLRVLFEPAIAAAREGVTVNRFQHYDFQLLRDINRRHPDGRRIYFPNNQPIAVGDRLRMPQLADFLDYLWREGPRAFYRGEVAQKIAADYRAGGGYLQLRDFEDYAVYWRFPLHFNYRGNTVYTNPDPATGGWYLRALIERLSSYSWDNIEPFGSEHLERLYAAFHELKKVPKTAQSLRDFCISNSVSSVNKNSSGNVRGNTTHFNITDRNGNAVSLTSTNGEGSGYFVKGTDIQLNNMLGEAALLPGGFHSWHPDQRLSSMMSPTIVTDREGRVRVVLGSGGAGRIAPAIAQVLHFLLDMHLDTESAVRAPRLHMDGECCNLEMGYENYEVLRSRVEELISWDEPSLYFGGVHTLSYLQSRAEAVGDHRRDGIAIHQV